MAKTKNHRLKKQEYFKDFIFIISLHLTHLESVGVQKNLELLEYFEVCTLDRWTLRLYFRIKVQYKHRPGELFDNLIINVKVQKKKESNVYKP